MDTLGAKAHEFTPGRVRNPGCADWRIRPCHTPNGTGTWLRADHSRTRRNRLTSWARR